jgi:uncharacterized protein YbbK (DUF523 family)
MYVADRPVPVGREQQPRCIVAGYLGKQRSPVHSCGSSSIGNGASCQARGSGSSRVAQCTKDRREFTARPHSGLQSALSLCRIQWVARTGFPLEATRLQGCLRDTRLARRVQDAQHRLCRGGKQRHSRFQHALDVCSQGSPSCGKRHQRAKGERHGCTLHVHWSWSATWPGIRPPHENASPSAVHHRCIGLHAGLRSGACGH